MMSSDTDHAQQPKGKASEIHVENRVPVTGKQAWTTPEIEDLGVGATATGAVPMGTPDGIGNVKS